MYYVINDIDNPSIDEDEDDAPFLEIHEELLTNPRQGWHSGESLIDPPKEVIRIEATPCFGYSEPPPDYYDDGISLMSPRLADLLTKCGVDNLELYPAEIVYRGVDRTFAWWAFNILGLVSVVDETGSDIRSTKSVARFNTSINGLIMDPAKTHGMLMFRLAENVMTTLVHESIKNAVQHAGINTFAFTTPENWVII